MTRMGWWVLLGLIGTCAAACNDGASSALAQARAEVARASGGEIEHAAPHAIDAARRALGEAERTRMNAGDPRVVEDLAYVALRRVEQGRIESRIADELAAAPPAAPRGGGPRTRAMGE